MRRSPPSAYLVSLALVVVLTALKLQVPAIGVRLPFLLYFAVVLFAAWRGGRGPALVTIVATIAVVNGFFLEPKSTLIQSGLFALEGIAIAEISEQLMRSRGDAFDAAEKLTTTLRSIADGVLVTDVRGCVVMLNPVAERLTGWKEEDAKGRALDDVFEAVDETTRDRIEPPVAKVLREKAAVGLTNHTAVIARGTRKESPIECRGSPLRDPTGAVRGVVLVFRDVAEEKRRASRAEVIADVTNLLAGSLDLRATLARVAGVLVPRYADWCAIEMVRPEGGGSEQVAVAHVDPAKITYAEELRKKYPPDPNAKTGVPNVLRTGKPEHYPEIPDELLVAGAIDEEHLRISRELALRSAIIVPLTARGRILGAITMVYAESKRRYSEADLAFALELAGRAALAVDNARLFTQERVARETADTATRLKDEFLATLSHELRTPLTSVLGWSRMLRERKLDEAKQTKALATIERNATAMAQLVDDLLDVSRIISGNVRLEVQPTALAPVVDAAIESVRPAAQAKEITIDKRLDDASSVAGDARRLQQIVWNILSNAVKFTPRGGRVEVSVRRTESSLELRVSDTGRGIDAAFLPFVFDRFRQADASFTRQAGGLGLGLAIARHLVELHGGTIAVGSEGKDRGATFTVHLPVSAVGAPASAPAPSSDRPEPAPPPEIERPEELRDKKVLVVDDDEDSRNLIAAVLADCGCDVTTASSVADAMACFEAARFDAVVSDIGMPNEDGYELIRRIRALPADRGGKVPAAALTAYARADDRRRVLAAGYITHVAKPVDPGELVAVVASLVRLSS